MSNATKGALSGLAGTAAMTVGQAIEMRASGRGPSVVPGQVATRLLRIKPSGDAQLAQISTGMHWAHGVTQGIVRAGVGALGLTGLAAAGVHFALMWTGDAALYKGLGIAEWPWRWTAAELRTDVLHKGTHALVSGAVYDRLR